MIELALIRNGIGGGRRVRRCLACWPEGFRAKEEEQEEPQNYQRKANDGDRAAMQLAGLFFEMVHDALFPL
jgi:hypothetical protein